MDLAGSNGMLHYKNASFGGTDHPHRPCGSVARTGVAFDNTLARAATASVALPAKFYRSLGTIDGASAVIGAGREAGFGRRPRV